MRFISIYSKLIEVNTLLITTHKHLLLAKYYNSPLLPKKYFLKQRFIQFRLIGHLVWLNCTAYVSVCLLLFMHMVTTGWLWAIDKQFPNWRKSLIYFELDRYSTVLRNSKIPLFQVNLAINCCETLLLRKRATLYLFK